MKALKATNVLNPHDMHRSVITVLVHLEEMILHLLMIQAINTTETKLKHQLPSLYTCSQRFILIFIWNSLQKNNH